MQSSKINPTDQLKNRRGIVTFWAIVTIPIFLIMLCIVLEIGNLWLARIQLKNALEAGALAAVKNWGDGGGGDTNISRMVGNQFASSLVINGTPVDLTTIDPTLNYDGANGTNENGVCSGVFVFGSITDDNPDYTFDSCSAAGCGPPFNIVMDVSQNGNLGSNPNNQWGISLQPIPQSPPGVYVEKVVIELPTTYSGGNPIFFFGSDTPDVSMFGDTDPQSKVGCNAGNIDCSPNPGTQGGGDIQGDVFGIDDSQVTFNILNPGDYGDDGSGGRLECAAVGVPAGNGQGKVLAINFCSPGNPIGCQTFDAGDHMRFGATVNNGGVSNYDADDIGAMGANVTFCFSDGTFLLGTFQDTTDNPNGGALNCSNVTVASWGQCYPQGAPVPAGNVDFIAGGGFSLGRRGISVGGLAFNQPVPPGMAAGNNGQSLVNFSGASASSGLGYAVRAQTSYDVPSVCNSLFGFPIGPFCVTAKADAIYECTTSLPRLYHLDDADFTCTTPCP